MKTILIRSDEDYTTAVNYKESFYNFPVTVNIENKKYIIGAGNSDSITIIDNEKYNIPSNEIVILTENSRLNYIGLTVIDTDTDGETDCFLSDNDLNTEENICFNLLEKEEKEQLTILFEYL